MLKSPLIFLLLNLIVLQLCLYELEGKHVI